MVFGLSSRLKSPHIFSWRCINIKFYGNYNNENTNFWAIGIYALLAFVICLFSSFLCTFLRYFHSISHINYTMYIYLYKRSMDFVVIVVGMLSWTGNRLILLGVYHYIVHIVNVIFRLRFFTFLSSFIIQIIYLFGVQKPKPVQIACCQLQTQMFSFYPVLLFILLLFYVALSLSLSLFLSFKCK